MQTLTALDGQSVASVARELGVGEGLLHQWKKARLATASDAEREVIELRKKLREVEMERDILNLHVDVKICLRNPYT